MNQRKEPPLFLENLWELAMKRTILAGGVIFITLSNFHDYQPVFVPNSGLKLDGRLQELTRSHRNQETAILITLQFMIRNRFSEFAATGVGVRHCALGRSFLSTEAHL